MRCRFFSPVLICDICNHLGFWAEKPASFPHWYEFSCRSLQTIDKFNYIDFFFYTGLLHYWKTYFNNTRNGKYWLAALWTSFVYFVWFLKFYKSYWTIFLEMTICVYTMYSIKILITQNNQLIFRDFLYSWLGVQRERKNIRENSFSIKIEQLL